MNELPVATQWLHGAAPPYAQQPIDAVAMIVVQPTGSKGTGWLVADRMLVTNEHVIRGGAPASIVARFPDGSAHGVLKIVAVDASTDLAVLELQSPPGVGSLKIDAAPVSVGTQIYALGFPLAYNGPAPLMIVGYIAGFEARTLTAGAAPQQRLVLNAALNPGNSGGPVLRWGESSVRGVVVSKHAPITPFLQSAIDALAGNQSGVVFTATDGQGKTHTFVESQLVADVLKYFRSMTQVVIGEAIPASDLISFLSSNKVSWASA
ncbi:MAG: trypsin-like peptidase domain-containing protein [Deltaproteobacteria bacterium]|nr:trypsin-like peptidase domain-containing protein [Deltaproteobacteria bacterium]